MSHPTDTIRAGMCGVLDLRVEIEKGLQAGPQLLLNLFFAALDYMHSHVRLTSACELDWSLAYLGHVFGGQKSHAIDQCQVRHIWILRRRHGFQKNPAGGFRFPAILS